MSDTHSDTLIVTYEDRTSAVQGVEVLARSLLVHSPQMKIKVYSPLESLRDLAVTLPNLEFIYTDKLIGRGWNVKPTVLMWALEDNVKSVIWLDTDIVISGDIGNLCKKVKIGSIAVGQEFSSKSHIGGKIRAEGWNLKIGRLIPYHVNSGSVQVDISHKGLIAHWNRLLDSAEYQSYQHTPGPRPPAFTGDQDALWALLVSEDFSTVPVHYFKVGSDMLIHCGARGFQIKDRMRNIIYSRPTFVHMLGKYKPWSFNTIPSKSTDPNAYRHAVCFELSPFHKACEVISQSMNHPDWMLRRTKTAKFWNAFFIGNVALRGLPMALISALASFKKLF